MFLYDMMHIISKVRSVKNVSQRYEQVFIDFITLLQTHYRRHHDIGFYADRLHVSVVYLSRIVRTVSNHSAASFINQMLLMEACFLLRTTDSNMSQVADLLTFSDQAAFSKFFKRMKGMKPIAFRKSLST